jgi:hypothetical protein
VAEMAAVCQSTRLRLLCWLLWDALLNINPHLFIVVPVILL